MIEFKHLKSFGSTGEETLVTIASGPVIIKDNKVLLDKHEDDFWKFPGGSLHSDNNLEENAKRRAKEELNIDIELKSDHYIITFIREREGKQELVVLIHYLAEIINGEPKPGHGIVEFAWYDVDNLPSDSAPNIKPVVEHFMKNKL